MLWLLVGGRAEGAVKGEDLREKERSQEDCEGLNAVLVSEKLCEL